MNRRRHRVHAPWRRVVPVVAAVLAVLGGGYAVLVLGHSDPARPAGAYGAPAGSSAPASPSPPGSPVPSPTSPGARPSGTPSPSAVSPAGRGLRLLFGIGTEADSAQRTQLVKQAPVRMLTSWYNGPNDLSWMAGWRTGTVPQAYRAGFALHLIVWTGDAEGALSTAYGPACGRGYPLSARFLDDMRQLAQIFAGTAGGPPLYVTLFTEFQTYPCRDNAWNPDAATTNYYRALQDQYRAALGVFHRYAANAKVSLGWGGWQASYDSPGDGGGQSLFAHFADVMRMSDFQSFQAMANDGNAGNIRAMVAILGRYGPVMLAHYKPDNGNQATFDADVRAILTDSYLSDEVSAGLFAMSFMDNTNLSASGSTLSFVKAAVTRYGRSW